MLLISGGLSQPATDQGEPAVGGDGNPLPLSACFCLFPALLRVGVLLLNPCYVLGPATLEREARPAWQCCACRPLQGERVPEGLPTGVPGPRTRGRWRSPLRLQPQTQLSPQASRTSVGTESRQVIPTTGLGCLLGTMILAIAVGRGDLGLRVKNICGWARQGSLVTNVLTLCAPGSCRGAS